jgi:hypothetical protein
LDNNSGSDPAFFKIGLTIAALKAEGTTPEVSEVFMARVIEGQTQSMIVQRRDTGMGSAGDELRLLARTNLQVSAMDILLKLENLGGIAPQYLLDCKPG